MSLGSAEATSVVQLIFSACVSQYWYSRPGAAPASRDTNDVNMALKPA